MSAPDDRPRSLGRFATRIVWSVLGLAVAYVLSTGPAGVICSRFCQARPEDPAAVAAKREACSIAINAFYSPLVTVGRASKTEPLLRYYSGWWLYIFQPEDGYRSSGGHDIFTSPTRYYFDPDLPPSAPVLPSSPPDASVPEPQPAAQ